MGTITQKDVDAFLTYLQTEERAPATLQKYRHDATAFCAAVGGRPLDKQLVMAYKNMLLQTKMAAGVNSALAAINGVLDFIGRGDCKVKSVKIQRGSYLDDRKILTRAEYLRLVNAANAKGNTRLALLLQTICATGIRVSELRFVTVQSLGLGVAEVCNKGKCRTVILPKALCNMLKAYCKRMGRRTGPVFVTRHGTPPDRTNIWAMMKSLCKVAGVAACKVYPHSLRHLFARCFYSRLKDLEHLSSILGHCNINTTRIYTQTTCRAHRRQIESLNLLL